MTRYFSLAIAAFALTFCLGLGNAALAQEPGVPVVRFVELQEEEGTGTAAPDSPEGPTADSDSPMVPPVFVPPQPPANTPAFDPALAASATALRLAASRRRLSSTPEMFGDYFGPTMIFTIGESETTTLVPAPGGGVAKVSDGNKATIEDRCFFYYHHFHHARNTRFMADPDPPEFFSEHLDRFTLGCERRIGTSPWSLELRQSVAVEVDFAFDDTLPMLYSANASELGNLALIFKRELFTSETTVLAAGCGTSLPTGNDTFGRTSDAIETFRLHNNAVHLMPFAAVQQIDGPYFLHGFVQLDVDLNGNGVELTGTTMPQAGRIHDQTLLLVDLGIGRWFYRDPTRSGTINGIAAMVECHYETALQDADILFTTTGAPTDTESFLGNTINRFDVVNLTAALEFELGRNMSLRTGGVFPLTTGTDRFFDAEVGVQLIWQPGLLQRTLN